MTEVSVIPEKTYIRSNFLERQKHEKELLERLYNSYGVNIKFGTSAEKLTSKLGSTPSKIQAASRIWESLGIIEKEQIWPSGQSGKQSLWTIKVSKEVAFARFEEHQAKERAAVNKPPKSRKSDSPRERIYTAIVEKGPFKSAHEIQETIKKPGENWSLHTITGHIANLEKQGRIKVDWSDQRGSKLGKSGPGTKPINIRASKNDQTNVATVEVEERTAAEAIADVITADEKSIEPEGKPKPEWQVISDSYRDPEKAPQAPTTALEAPKLAKPVTSAISDYVNAISQDYRDFPITMALVNRRERYETVAKQFEDDDQELAIMILERRATFTTQEKEMMALYDSLTKCRDGKED